MTRYDPRPALELAYAARSKSLRRRRILVLVGVTILLCALTPLVVRYARMGAERVRVNRLYRTCAAHVAPASTVVWEEDPQLIKPLLGRGYETVASHDGDAAYFVPAAWRELNEAIGQRIHTWGTLFVHERKTPTGGKPLLVGVDVAGWSRGGPVVLFARVRTISPAVPLRLPRAEKVDHPSVHLAAAEGSVRIFAGQPDPADPTHFTIDYAVGPERGVIDGYLKNDGRVVLEKRVNP